MGACLRVSVNKEEMEAYETNQTLHDHETEPNVLEIWKKFNVNEVHETKSKAVNSIHETHLMEEFEKSLSQIIGLKDLKTHLRNLAKGMLLDKKRRAMNIPTRDRVIPNMLFMGNPGTGKTMVGNMIGKILHQTGLLTKEEVTVVQRSDLIGDYIGHTGPKARKKIQEAHGGVLFLDEAYKLRTNNDYGREALEEIMYFMDKGEVVVFAGYAESMEKVINLNAGFRTRVTKFFNFNDYTPLELAEILHLKVTNAGYKLAPSCTLENIAELMNKETSKEFRSKRNGRLIVLLIQNALANLDARFDLDCYDAGAMVTITMEDLEKGLQQLCQELEY